MYRDNMRLAMTDEVAPQVYRLGSIIVGTVPPPADPNLPLAGYALWLNPSYRADSVFQDAARVTPAAVGDLVGGLYDATSNITATASGAARPTRGSTSMTFSGAQALTLSSAPTIQSLLIVATFANPGNVNSYLIGNAVDVITLFGYDDDAQRLRLLAAGVGGYASAGSLRTDVRGVRKVFTVVVNGGNAQIAINNAPQGAPIAIGALAPDYIGAFVSGRFMIGEICEILTYTTALDGTALTAEITKAAARCGVTL